MTQRKMIRKKAPRVLYLSWCLATLTVTTLSAMPGLRGVCWHPRSAATISWLPSAWWLAALLPTLCPHPPVEPGRGLDTRNHPSHILGLGWGLVWPNTALETKGQTLCPVLSYYLSSYVPMLCPYSPLYLTVWAPLLISLQCAAWNIRVSYA